MSKAIRRITNPDLIAHALMVKAMIENIDQDNHQIADYCGLTYLTVCRHTAALHQVGAAHIYDWKPDQRGAFTVRVFRLGAGDDAIAPVRPRAVRAREQRKREKLRAHLAGRVIPLPKYG